MRGNRRIGVVIPALNEERSIGRVLEEIPAWADEIIVVDNGSTDRTAEKAREGGARVVFEPRRGYGAACLKGIVSLKPADVVVFLDGDLSDYPEQMDRLVEPILSGEAGMVIGSRVLGTREEGALTPQARFGNRLSCLLIRLFWGVRYTDLGPFRAIGSPYLARLGMRDRDYGWTVEMQIKAAVMGIRSMEVPVDYRKRIGVSKVSGSLKGVILAGVKILYTIFRSVLEQAVRRRRGKKKVSF
jgi:glycosyltransferase involved in cell wall biosynthesis